MRGGLSGAMEERGESRLGEEEEALAVETVSAILWFSAVLGIGRGWTVNRIGAKD